MCHNSVAPSVLFEPTLHVVLQERPLAIDQHLVLLGLYHSPDLVSVVVREVPLRVREPFNPDLLHALLPGGLDLTIDSLYALELIWLHLEQLDVINREQREVELILSADELSFDQHFPGDDIVDLHCGVERRENENRQDEDEYEEQCEEAPL